MLSPVGSALCPMGLHCALLAPLPIAGLSAEHSAFTRTPCPGCGCSRSQAVFSFFPPPLCVLCNIWIISFISPIHPPPPEWFRSIYVQCIPKLQVTPVSSGDVIAQGAALWRFSNDGKNPRLVLFAVFALRSVLFGPQGGCVWEAEER